MPKSRRSSRVSWLFREKPVVAHAGNGDVDLCDRFGLSIRYEDAAKLGSITIHHAVPLEGFETDQTLSLIVRPELIISCDVCLDSCGVPLQVLALTPDTASGIVVVSLRLRAPGGIICPITSLPLSIPSEHTNTSPYMAFSRLCQATKIQLYLGKHQLQAEQRMRLQNFITEVSNGRLRANPVDLRCLAGGRGAQETTWTNVESPYITHPEAAPARQGAVREVSQVEPHSRKRSPESPAFGPSTKAPRLWYACPPGSPTEVNTPSTRQGTPQSKGHAQSTKQDTSPSEGHMLAKQRSPILLREETPLPAYTADNNTSNITRTQGTFHYSPLSTCPTETDRQITPPPVSALPNSSPWGSSRDIKPTAFGSGVSLTHALGDMLQQMLPKIIEGAFSTVLGPLIDARLDALVSGKIEALVQEQLPRLTNEALQQNMNKFYDTVEDGHKRAEVELTETIDDAKTELHDARDQGIKDIEAYAQEHFDEVDAVIDAATTAALETLEDRTDLLKTRLDDHWQYRWQQQQKMDSSLQPRRRSI